MVNIQNYYRALNSQSKNTGNKLVQKINNNALHKKAYIKPETNNATLFTKRDLCDSRDVAMDRWERTNGHPERELEDVQMYLPNGKYISKRTGRICG